MTIETPYGYEDLVPRWCSWEDLRRSLLNLLWRDEDENLRWRVAAYLARLSATDFERLHAAVAA